MKWIQTKNMQNFHSEKYKSFVFLESGSHFFSRGLSEAEEVITKYFMQWAILFEIVTFCQIFYDCLLLYSKLLPSLQRKIRRSELWETHICDRFQRIRRCLTDFWIWLWPLKEFPLCRFFDKDFSKIRCLFSGEMFSHKTRQMTWGLEKIW